MFRTVPRLGEVCVCTLEAWILIAVAELLGEAEVAVVVVLFFGGALGAVGIVFGNLRPRDPSAITDHWALAPSPRTLILFSRSSRDSQLAQTFTGLQGFVGFRIALDHVAKLHHSIFLLAQLD